MPNASVDREPVPPRRWNEEQQVWEYLMKGQWQVVPVHPALRNRRRRR